MTHEYRLGACIGRGGMAEVHLAVQGGPAGFNRLVVVKRIRPGLAERPELRRTLYDEARVLARLSHPNVVQLLDLGHRADGPFLVVEYLPGETLLTVLRALASSGARPPWPVVCRIGADLAAGLAAAHGAPGSPILHRDLTPSNVILCRSGAVKLIDFGIAKEQVAIDTKVGTVKGKFSYLAPELLCGGRPDSRSDLWQLGVVLHEAACGRRLFEGPDDAARVHAVLHRPIPRLRRLVEVPVELDRLVAALLSRDPAERIGSAETARRELEEVMRRGGQALSGHQLGDWLRQAVPEHLARRDAREQECLSTVVDGEPDTVMMAPLPARARASGRRWKRVTLIAAVAAILGGGAAASRRTIPNADAGAVADDSVPDREDVNRTPGTGNSEPGTGNSEPETGIVRQFPVSGSLSPVPGFLLTFADPDRDPDPDPDPDRDPDPDPVSDPDPDPDPDPDRSRARPRARVGPVAPPVVVPLTDNLDPWSSP